MGKVRAKLGSSLQAMQNPRDQPRLASDTGSGGEDRTAEEGAHDTTVTDIVGQTAQFSKGKGKVQV